MKETFYLIRHGERESTSDQTMLTHRGVEQAKMAAGELERKGGVSAIYSSPLPRTIQTAEAIAAVLGQEVKVDKRLIERVRWGDRPGETYEEFIAEWDKTLADRDYRPVGGDSSRETGRRVRQALDEIKDKERVAIVTHDGAIWDFLKNEFVEGKSDLPEYLAHPRRLAFCSITEIARNGGEYTLVDFNNTSFLPNPITD